MTKEDLLEVIAESIKEYVDPQYDVDLVAQAVFEKLSEELEFDFEEEDEEIGYDEDDDEAQEYEDDIDE